MLLSVDELPYGWGEYPFRVNLSCRSAVWSMFDRKQNEFWMIWTDIFPVCVFVFLFTMNVTSDPFMQRNALLIGLYLAVILSRICSGVYHVFNCVSLKVNRTLIKLDQIGICCMAMGAPWFFVIVNQSHLGAYICILLSVFSCCLLMIVTDSPLLQPALCVLAVIGNYPLLQIALSPALAIDLRLMSLMALNGFLLGYVFFYLGKFPECLLPMGNADGRFWHSHVLWHVVTFVSQLLCVLTTTSSGVAAVGQKQMIYSKTSV